MRDTNINDISRQILDDYRELTGIDAMPSIPEYIEIRRQAIEEYKTGVQTRQEPIIREVKSSPPKKEKDVPKKAIKKENVVTQGNAAINQPEEQKHTKSDFEILRGLKDEWN